MGNLSLKPPPLHHTKLSVTSHHREAAIGGRSASRRGALWDGGGLGGAMGWEVRAWKRADAPELLRMLRVRGGGGYGGGPPAPSPHTHRGGPPQCRVPALQEWAELEGGPRPSCEEGEAPTPPPVTPP